MMQCIKSERYFIEREFNMSVDTNFRNIIGFDGLIFILAAVNVFMFILCIIWRTDNEKSIKNNSYYNYSNYYHIHSDNNGKWFRTWQRSWI